MKFECDSCHAQYMIADEKVGKRGVKVKCKKCQHVIIVRPESGGEPKEAKAEKPQKAAPIMVPVVEKPVETVLQPPPPGLNFSEKDDSNGTESFAHGGPTDPGVPSMGMQQDEPGDDLPVRAPPPPPLNSSDDGNPESTGPNLAPAPVSLFGDATHVSKNPMNMDSEPAPPKDARTELAAAPSMSSPGTAPGERERADRNDATVVTAQAPPEEEPAAPRQKKAAAAPPPPAADDALDDQLAGAFNAMFDGARSSGDSDEEHRGPTRVLDNSAVDALRKQAAAGRSSSSEVNGFKNGPDPRQLDEGMVKVEPRGAAGADDGPAEQVWHVAIDDQDVGPLSLGEVGRHIEAGRVDRESLVWKIGMDDWLPAGDVPLVRALFDKVPMPRIARVDDEPQVKPAMKGGGRPTFENDLGAPIDDDFAGDRAAPSGPSPFDDASDPSWRPHGLTDVYQAANLAEAAGMGALGSIGGSLGAPLAPMGGMGGMGTKSSSGSSSPPSSANAEPEWRPAAASALASLVQDEIKRLDNGPPPASDDDLSPADDASINAPMFGSLAAGKDLEAGPEVSDGSIGPGNRAARPAAALPTFNAQGQQSPSYPPQGGFMTTPPQRTGMSPVLIGGIAGGALLVITVIVLVVVLAMKGNDTDGKVVMIEGKAYVMMGGKPIPMGGESEKKPPDGEKIAMTDKVADKAVDPAKKETVPAPVKEGGDGTNTANVDAAKEKEKVVVASEGEPEKVIKHDAAPKVVAKHVDTPKIKEKDDPPKPPVKIDDTPPKSTKGCDPVLDFDCGKKTGDKPPPPPPPADLKEKLAPSDVLQVAKANLSKIEGCGKKNKASGVIKMSWKISPKGGVSDVQVADTKFAGTPVGSCVTNEIKSWRFPATKASAPLPITNFPMKLP